MNWTQEDIDAFLKVIDTRDNETGGGTASAVAGAMAAGLAGMVARVSIGKNGMEPEDYYLQIDAAARDLTGELFRGGREDSQAFGDVMRAFALPRSTDEEQAARSGAIQRGMIGAARVPLANAERCLRVLDLIDRLEGRSNTNAASDLSVARALAAAALEGCLANVDINLKSIRDEGVRSELAARADELHASPMATSGPSTDPAEGDADV
jgi:formiminotetrahydrofolate cyclodeaminase